MIKLIVKDMLFLQQKAQPARKENVGIGQDLFDILKANQDKCVGMVANMIEIQKEVIIFMYGMESAIIFNPIVKRKSSSYPAKKSCLSLVESRLTTCYKEFTVEYLAQYW